MNASIRQVHVPELTRHEILKVPRLHDDKVEFVSVDFDLRVAPALSFAAALPDLDLERAWIRQSELPLRPVVRIDPIAEAILIRRWFVAQHDAVGCGVPRKEGEATGRILRDGSAFGCRPKRHGLE